jgi:hypothetical protein
LGWLGEMYGRCNGCLDGCIGWVSVWVGCVRWLGCVWCVGIVEMGGYVYWVGVLGVWGWCVSVEWV